MTRASIVDVEVRRATEDDDPAVAVLVAARGLPLDGLNHAWRTWVAVCADQIVGTASLERHDGALLLRSVAVAPELAGAGIGARLVQAALQDADGMGPVALLTDTAADWFPRFGFTATTRDELPAALAGSPELQHACPASASAMIDVLFGAVMLRRAAESRRRCWRRLGAPAGSGCRDRRSV